MAQAVAHPVPFPRRRPRRRAISVLRSRPVHRAPPGRLPAHAQGQGWRSDPVRAGSRCRGKTEAGPGHPFVLDLVGSFRDVGGELPRVLRRARAGTGRSAGRFTESLFRGIESQQNDRLAYVERIVGDFTLAKRAAGFEHVLMVGTGTGLAPFVSMVKQLHRDAIGGKAPPARYTLFHANRTHEELAYHQELLDIEASQAFDFVYVPSVSRPSTRDLADPQIGTGRASNLLRQLFGFPSKEPSVATAPTFPRNRPLELLQKRVDPARTVVLTCGNPAAMADIGWLAAQTGMRFEKEDW